MHWKYLSKRPINHAETVFEIHPSYGGAGAHAEMNQKEYINNHFKGKLEQHELTELSG